MRTDWGCFLHGTRPLLRHFTLTHHGSGHTFSDVGLGEGCCRWLTAAEVTALYSACAGDASPGGALVALRPPTEREQRRLAIRALWKRAWRLSRRSELAAEGGNVGKAARRRVRQAKRDAREQRRREEIAAAKPATGTEPGLRSIPHHKATGLVTHRASDRLRGGFSTNATTEAGTSQHSEGT